MSNTDFLLSDIANAIKNIDGFVDNENIEDELKDLNATIQNLNDDLNEKLDKLIEALTNGRN